MPLARVYRVEKTERTNDGQKAHGRPRGPSILTNVGRRAVAVAGQPGRGRQNGRQAPFSRYGPSIPKKSKGLRVSRSLSTHFIEAPLPNSVLSLVKPSPPRPCPDRAQIGTLTRGCFLACTTRAPPTHHRSAPRREFWPCCCLPHLYVPSFVPPAPVPGVGCTCLPCPRVRAGVLPPPAPPQRRCSFPRKIETRDFGEPRAEAPVPFDRSPCSLLAFSSPPCTTPPG